MEASGASHGLTEEERAVVASIIGDPVMESSPVWERDHVQWVLTRAGSSFVVKRPRRSQPGESDPEVAGRRFRSELANLTYLQGVPDEAVPRLVGSDARHRLLVMEDLPSGRSLADSLLDSDRDRALADLHSYARALARLHRWSLEHPQDRDEPDAPWGFAAAARSGIEDLAAVAERLGLVAGASFRSDCEEAIRLLEDGGRWRGFVHGDGCPDNTLITDDRFVFFDFEHSTVGSVLIDASYLVAPFPTCWCWAVMPEGVSSALLETYRGAVGDGPGFDAGIAAALAAWVISRGPAIATALDGDRVWGTTGLRPRLVQWTAAFAARAGSAFPAITAMVEPLTERLDEMWDEPRPAYPSLAEHGQTAVAAPDWFGRG